jgi:hypothetical protein
MRRSTPCLLLLILALLPCGASAQTPQTPRPQQPEGAPPPPLFPKHRRGFYINNDKVEVIDATPQSPPLETDDPSVPDKGEYEINLLTEADLGSDARNVNMLGVDANYGLVLKARGHAAEIRISHHRGERRRKSVSGGPGQFRARREAQFLQ